MGGDGKNRHPQSSVEKGVKGSSLVGSMTASIVEQVHLEGGDRKDEPVEQNYQSETSLQV